MLVRRAWVVMGFAWIGGVGCDSPPPVAPVQSVEPPPAAQTKADQEDPVASTDKPTPVAVNIATAPTLGVELQAVRRLADTVEIEVVLDRALTPMGSIRPSLEIGGEVTRRSRVGNDGRLDHLIFTVDNVQFERMRTDTEIIVRAGPWSNEVSERKPRLSEVAMTGEGNQP